MRACGGYEAGEEQQYFECRKDVSDGGERLIDRSANYSSLFEVFFFQSRKVVFL